MGLKDWFSKGKKAAADQADTVKQGIDSAADFADEKTGERFSGQIDTGAEAAKDAVDKLTDE